MALDYKEVQKELEEYLQLEKIPEEKREELINKMGEALFKRIFLETMERLGDIGVTEYDKLLEKQASADEMDEFLEKRIPNYNEFLRSVVEKFKADLKERR